MTDAAGNRKRIRNIGVIAHIDAGKTTLSERFLFYSGKTHRIGDVDCGNTVMDYLDEERSRGISITSAAASFAWNDTLVHLIDTPGHIDFTAEVERSLRVADGAVVIFSGVEGVEAQSEKVWKQSDHYQVSKIAFVNKLDRSGASFSRTVDNIRRVFSGILPLPLQIPFGEESGLRGVIDLITMKLLLFSGNDGGIVETADIPAECAESAAAAREAMLSVLADLDDAIAEAYLEERQPDPDYVRGLVRKLTVASRVCPVLCGSAKRNVGVQPLLDAIGYYLPSPDDRPEVNGFTADGDGVTVRIDDHNFYALVFKLIAGGGADLLYMRIYAGSVGINDTLWNPRAREKTRVKRILRLYAGSVEAIDSASAGDIVGIIGPAGVCSGDTLCCVNRPLLLSRIDFPEPVLSIAIEPRSAKDRPRLDACLAVLCREDPTLSMSVHEATGQTLLSGMGELHLEVTTRRIETEFHLEARYGKPRVSYRETLSSPCNVSGVFDRMIGNKQLHTEALLEFRLRKDAVPPLVEIAASNPAIPTRWFDTARRTLEDGLRTGGVNGYPLIQLEVVLRELRGDQDNSSEPSVAGAVLDAISQAVRLGTAVLEPLMRLDITAPEDSIGEVSSYLQARRAVIREIVTEPHGDTRLCCEAPLAEMFGFSKALPKLSGGRGSMTMEPCGYQELPQEVDTRFTAV